MVKIIIYFPGNPTIWGPKVRDFQWSQKHKAYVWQGRELSPEEFNRVERKALTADDITHYQPSVRVIEAPATAEVLPLAPAKTLAEERALWAGAVKAMRATG